MSPTPHPDPLVLLVKQLSFEVTYDGHQNPQNVLEVYFVPISMNVICVTPKLTSLC